MGLGITKPVFGVSDKVRLKPVSSATETNLENEISLVVSWYMILSKKQISKALIRLPRWLFTNPEDRISLIEAHMVNVIKF